jgi:hypothetical protein
MAVEKELWQADIVEQIFQDNSFLEFVTNEDEYVVGGRIVHIPQSGGAGKPKKNRSSLPAQVRRRNDTDITYPLDEYTSDPILIKDAEKKELSYDKRKSCVEEDRQALSELVGEDFLYKFAKDLPEECIIETTGDSVPATADSATGNRKKFVMQNLKKAQTKLNKQGLPKKDRYALISAEMMEQLFPTDDQNLTLQMLGVTQEERDQGIMAVRCGFKLLDRGTVLRYASNGTLKAPEALGEAGDNEGVLCWHKSGLGRSMGDTEFFEDEGKPEYYGDIYSMLKRAGGRRRREDNKGVVVIRQKAV